MSGAYHLGDNDRYGSIDLSKLKSGITVDEFVTKCGADNEKAASALKDWFMQFAGDDGVLSQDEIKGTLTQYLSGAAGDDGIISDSEGRKIKDNTGENIIGKQSREQLFKFLQVLSAFTENVEKVIHENDNPDVLETIEYESGKKREVVYKDGRKDVITHKNGITTTTCYDKEGTKTKVITEQNGIETTTFYNNKNEITQIVETDTLGTKTVKDGQNNILGKEFNTDNGKRLLEYKNDKVYRITTTTKNSKAIQTFNDDGTYNMQVEKDGVIVEKYQSTCSSDDKPSSILEKERIVTRKDAQKGQIIEKYKEGDKKISQSIDGKTVQYDGKGNTIVVVQNGESVALLAKRFDVGTKEIVELNKSQVRYTKGGKPYFKVGAEIVIPGEIAADSEVFNGRKSKKEVISEFNAAWRAEQERKAAAEQQQNVDNAKDPQTILKNFGGKEKLLEIKFPTKGNSENTFKYALDSDGNVWFYDNNGNWLGEEKQKKIVNVLANSVVGMIKIKSPAGIVNEGIKGDFPDNIKKAIEPYILSKDILEAVNEQLKQEGYNKSIQMPKSVAQKIKKLTPKKEGELSQEIITQIKQERRLEAVGFITDRNTDASAILDNREEDRGLVSHMVQGWYEIWGIDESLKNSQKKIADLQTKVETLLSSIDSDEFETNFKKLFGVEYSDENVRNCVNLCRCYTDVKAKHDKLQEIKNMLIYGCTAPEEWQTTAAVECNTVESSRRIIAAFKMCGFTTKKQIDDMLRRIEAKSRKENPELWAKGGNRYGLRLAKDKNGHMELMISTNNLSCAQAGNDIERVVVNELEKMLDEVFLTHVIGEDSGKLSNFNRKQMEEMANGRLKELENKYMESLKKAYGQDVDVAMFAQKAVEREMKGVQNVEMGFDITMAVLSLVPVVGEFSAGALEAKAAVDAAKYSANAAKAAKFTTAAKWIGYGSTSCMILRPLDFVEKCTSPSGMSNQEFHEWFNQVVMGGAFLLAGAGIGKVAESLGEEFVAAKTMKFLNESYSKDAIKLMMKNKQLPSDFVKGWEKIEKSATALEISSDVLMNALLVSGVTYASSGGQEFFSTEALMFLAIGLAGGMCRKGGAFSKQPKENQIRGLKKAFEDAGLGKLSDYEAEFLLQQIKLEQAAMAVYGTEPTPEHIRNVNEDGTPVKTEKSILDQATTDALSNYNNHTDNYYALEDKIYQSSVEELRAIRRELETHKHTDPKRTNNLKKATNKRLQELTKNKQLSENDLISLKQEIDNMPDGQLKTQLFDNLNNHPGYKNWLKKTELIKQFEDKLKNAKTPEEVDAILKEYQDSYNEIYEEAGVLPTDDITAFRKAAAAKKSNLAEANAPKPSEYENLPPDKLFDEYNRLKKSVNGNTVDWETATRMSQIKETLAKKGKIIDKDGNLVNKPAEQPKPVQEEKPVDMLDAMKEESRKTRNMEPEDGVALKEEQVYPKDNSEANPKKSVSDEVKPVEAEQPELVKPVEAPKEPAATAKPYSEMSEQELLAEYKKLYNDNTKDFGQNFDNEYRKGVIRDELKDRGVYIDEEGNVFSRTSVETNKPVTEEPVEANPKKSVSDEVKPVEIEQPEPVKPVEAPKEPAATAKPEPIKVPTEKEIKAITDANKLLEEYNNLRKLQDTSVITKAEYKQIEKRLSQIEKRLKKDFKKQIGKDGKLEDIPEKTTNKKPAEKKVENTDNSKSKNVKKMDETELTNEYNDLKNKLQESDIAQEAKTKYEKRIQEIEEAFASRGYTMVDGHPSLPSEIKLKEMSPDDLAALYNKCRNIKDKTARNQYRHQIEDVLDKQGYKMRRDGVVDKHSFRTGLLNYKKTTDGQKNIGLLSSKTLSIGPEITGGKRAWELNSPWFLSESLPLRIGRGIDGYDGLTISIGTGGDFDVFSGINIRFGGKGSSGTRVNGDFFGMFGKKRAQKASQKQQVTPDVPSNPETPVVNSKKSQPMGLNSADQITPHEFSKGTKQEGVTSKPKDYESKMAELKSKYPNAREMYYDQTEHAYVVRSDEITYVYSEGGTLKMTDQTNHAKNVRTYDYLKEDGITSDYRVDYDYKNKIGIVYDGQTKIAEINYKKDGTTVTKYDTLGKVISSQDYGSGDIKVNETYVKQLVDDARKTRVNEQPVVHENPQKLNDIQEHKVTKEGNITSVYYGDRKIVEIIDYGPEQGITIKELYKNVTRMNLSIDPNPTQVQIKKWLEEAKRSFEL